MSDIYLAFVGAEYYPGKGLDDLAGIFAEQEPASAVCVREMEKARDTETSYNRWASVWKIKPNLEFELVTQYSLEGDLDEKTNRITRLIHATDRADVEATV